MTSLKRGVVSTAGGAFLLEDTTFCGGGGQSGSRPGVILHWGRGAF